MDILSLMSRGFDSELPAVPTKAADSGFVDVLELVQDIEVSQSNLVSADETMELMESQINTSQFGADPNMALLDSALMLQRLGQAEAAPLESPAERSAVELKQEAASVMNRMDWMRPDLQLQKPDSKLAMPALAAWTQALARDEISSVEQGPAEPFRARSEMPIPQEALGILSGSQTEMKPAPAVEQGLVREPMQDLTQDPFKPSSESHVNRDHPARKDEAPRVKVELSNQGSNSQWSGSAFVLDQWGTQKSGVPSSSKLEMPSELTNRLEPAQLRFVSDRIEALRAQGGGELRVQLNPENMGSIELRVSRVRDSQGVEQQIRVEIRAERGDVAQWLQESRSDLVDQMAKTQSRSVDLEIHSVQGISRPSESAIGVSSSAGLSSQGWFELRSSPPSQLRSVSEDDPGVKSKDGFKLASFDFVKDRIDAQEARVDSRKDLELGREAVFEAEPAELQRDFVKTPTAVSDESGLMNSDSDREQRRDRAQNQWAANSGFRDSA
jgi:hypothetical protein